MVRVSVILVLEAMARYFAIMVVKKNLARAIS
jgi:hypothetical protein